jgi:hypothetical protein
MRKLAYTFAIAAVSGLTSFAASTLAMPVTSGVVSDGAVLIMDGDGLVQKVHGFHCKRKRGPFNRTYGLHRHFRACDRYDDSYYDYPYDRPYYGHYPYRRPYYYGGFPFITFGFGGFGDDDWRWRRRGWGGWRGWDD